MEYTNNSKRGVIVLIFFIIIGICGFVAIYFLYEKPTQVEEYPYSNVSIYALYNNENVEIPYTIETMAYIKNGTTFKYGASMHEVLTNQSFKVYNYPGEYYQEVYYSDNMITDNYRVNLNLVKPGNVTYEVLDKFDENKNINFKLNVSGEYKKAKLCLDWSVHIIKVDISNLNRTYYDNYPRCYYLGDIKDYENTFNLNYNFFGILDNKDYINVYLIDEINTTHILNLNYTGY